MRITKAFQLSLNMLLHSKLRSWLTIIGIVIGIAAVVSIISVSEGAKQSLEQQLSSLGADVLTVSPGSSRATGAGGGFRSGGFGGGGLGGGNVVSSGGKNLTSRDILVLRTVPNVKLVMGTVSGREDVSYLSKTASISIKGVDAAVWKDFTAAKLHSGRFLTKGDTNAIVVGSRVANSVFEVGMQINRQVTIEGKIFKIVGILEESGSDDSTIYMPLLQARDVLEDVGQDEFNSISVKIVDVDVTDETITQIDQKLMMSRGILDQKKKDFTVTSPKAFQQTVSDTLSSISLFLAAIAAISLLVGAVGIANSMFTSVLEKTKDIGIMKAIGAQNKDILLVFLFNSGMLGLVGGIGGVALGVLGASFVSGLSGGASLGRLSLSSVYFSPTLIIGAFLLSIVVGMVAGAIPAYRASKLKPVDALRYQ